MGALDNYSIVFVIFINFFGQLKDWVGQVLLMAKAKNSQACKRTRGSQEPVIAHMVFNLTSNVDRKWGCYT